MSRVFHSRVLKPYLRIELIFPDNRPSSDFKVLLSSLVYKNLKAIGCTIITETTKWMNKTRVNCYLVFIRFEDVNQDQNIDSLLWDITQLMRTKFPNGPAPKLDWIETLENQICTEKCIPTSSMNIDSADMRLV